MKQIILFLGLTALVQPPLGATCFPEPAKESSSRTFSASPNKLAPTPVEGALPAIPVLAGPADETVLDGGSTSAGNVIMPPDENGMSVRAPLELSWTLPAPAGVNREATANPIPDTTHYRICVFEADKEPLCDSNAIPLNETGIVRYVKSCDGSDMLLPPGGALANFRPSREARVTELRWKVQACNNRRFRCAEWSDRRSLRWLPAPALLSPPNRSVETSRGPDGLGATLAIDPVVNAEKIRFCIARPGDRCPEMVTYRQPDSPNPVPLVREPQGTEAETTLAPQVELGLGDTAIPLRSWFDGQTVNWTAAACLLLPNTEAIADESRRMGCVYQERYRSITFPQ